MPSSPHPAGMTACSRWSSEATPPGITPYEVAPQPGVPACNRRLSSERATPTGIHAPHQLAPRQPRQNLPTSPSPHRPPRSRTSPIRSVQSVRSVRSRPSRAARPHCQSGQSGQCSPLPRMSGDRFTRVDSLTARQRPAPIASTQPTPSLMPSAQCSSAKAWSRSVIFNVAYFSSSSRVSDSELAKLLSVIRSLCEPPPTD
jgi:hypothetical protein